MRRPRTASRAAVGVAVTAFFMVTLDAVVVTVALPSIRDSLGGGVQGLQWVVDGYTLMFAALLLSAGAFCDRTGARKAMAVGLGLFSFASLGCALAPSLGWLVGARFAQGAAAAAMMPASLALIGQAHRDPSRRGRAVALWALGAAVASTSGPVIGGFLNLYDWRLIFLLNLPVGLAALIALRRAAPSPQRTVPFDLWGQLTAVVAVTGITYAIIEAGEVGLGSRKVLAALLVCSAAALGFWFSQTRGRHPMVPRDLVRSPTMRVASVVGFAFMVGFYGLPFLYSLYLQQERGLSSLATGTVFVPMMVTGLVLTPFSARVVERVGPRLPITGGLAVMTVGLTLLAVVPVDAPLWLLSALMVLIGLGGPMVMPPVTALLLNSVRTQQAGTASGIFNTARQLGGALAIAVFGALVAEPDHFVRGLRTSLLIAATVLLLSALASTQLTPQPATRRPDPLR